jgi:hypothetical protein
MFVLQQLKTATEERCFLSGPCRDVITRTAGAMSELCDIHEPVKTLAEDTVRIRYQEMTSEDTEDFMCDEVTVIFRGCKPVRLLELLAVNELCV